MTSYKQYSGQIDDMIRILKRLEDSYEANENTHNYDHDLDICKEEGLNGVWAMAMVNIGCELNGGCLPTDMICVISRCILDKMMYPLGRPKE